MITVDDYMGADEVKKLLNISDRTLRSYRANFWKEGIHYSQPSAQALYIRPMIADWILNHRSNPIAHQQAIEDWIKKCQKRAK